MTDEEKKAAEAEAAQAAEQKDNEIATLKGDMEVLKKEVAEKDATIATLEGIAEERDQKAKDLTLAFHNLEEKDKTIAELKAANEKLAKQVDDLKAEVKELSEKPTPMVTAESGVPAANGTGEAPKSSNQQRIKPGMSYEEIRKAEKEKAMK